MRRRPVEVLEDLERLALVERTTPADRRTLAALLRRDGRARVTLRGADQRRGGVQLEVVATPQPRGGVRLWWSCPSCSRRAGVLYGHGANTGAPLCYRCAGRLYRSQRDRGGKVHDQVERHARAAVRARKLRVMYPDGRPRRPRRSPRQDRLRAREQAAVNAAVEGAVRLSLQGDQDRFDGKVRAAAARDRKSVV